MEAVHGVDVSWLHRSKTDHAHQKSPSKESNLSNKSHSPSASSTPQDAHETNIPQATKPQADRNPLPSASSASPPQTSTAKPNTPPTPTATGQENVSSGKNDSSAKKSTSRKSAWMSSLSSRLSHSARATPPTAAEPEAAQTKQKGKSATSPLQRKQSSDYFSGEHANDSDKESKDDVPALPQSPKSSGSFLGALRRMSSGQSSMMKPASSGGVVPRQVLNVDKGRERCPIEQLNQSRLRRVAFSVDVEIAGHSRYIPEDDEQDSGPSKKAGSKSSKDKGEGAALKNPTIAMREKDGKPASGERQGSFGSSSPPGPGGGSASIPWGLDDEFAPRRKESAEEQKARETEEEEKRKRKEEKKRRKEEKLAAEQQAAEKEAAEKQAQLAAKGASEDSSTDPTNPGDLPPITDPEQTHSKGHDKPTTDPLRMYRRCCQLREAPVLKRISEQLNKLSKCGATASGIVPCLDLRHSRMQLTDIQCLGDWLAIVPVKKLLLEDANLTDEGVRVILSGLLAAKPPGLIKRKRGKSSPTRLRDSKPKRTPGVIEKITLKNNSKITQEGWKHICLFLNMSKSLKAIDLSMIPFPGDAPIVPDKVTLSNGVTSKSASQTLLELFEKSLLERLAGDHLDELLVDECGLSSYHVGRIAEVAIKCHLKLLGLASNDLDDDGLKHAARFISSPSSKGLDIGGTNLRGKTEIISNAMNNKTTIFALSVANCNLDVPSLSILFSGLVKLTDFRFLDLSHNHDLFAKHVTALGLLRKYIPQLPLLKRFHLMDVGMSPAQAISVAEILPEARNLAHLSILENPQLTALAGPVNDADQEEACAFYASYMLAVRLSKTLMCIDVDVPSKDSSEIVKALARQIVAYCLRNLENFTEADAIQVDDAANALPDISDLDKNVAMPELVTHLIDQVDEELPLQNSENAPDDDYITGGAGVVKALTYLLNASDLRRGSMSGTESPSQRQHTEEEKAKAKEMSKALLGTARQIKSRMRPMRERLSDSQADDSVMKRLMFFDQTLSSMIERFEREYPETKVPSAVESGSGVPSGAEPVDFTHSPARSRTSSLSEERKETDASTPPATSDPNNFLSYNFTADTPTSPIHIDRQSHHNSETSLASRAQAIEEGQMHRLGQRFRRELLPPSGSHDYLHGTSDADPLEPQYMTALRQKAEAYNGEQIRAKIRSEGLEAFMQEFIDDKEQLRKLETENPDQFYELRDDLVRRASMVPKEESETGSPPAN